MENRQPTYPGRVVLTPVPGLTNTYDMTRADDPTVEGTPLNKETLLQDATCALLDIPDTSVPNDAFAKLALGIGKYGYVIHVQYPDGSPADGFTLTGLNAPDGTAAVTNANGDAVGVSTEQNVTFGITSPFVDIPDISGVSVKSSGILTQYTVTIQYSDEPRLFETSIQSRISPKAVTMDFTAVGGGGAGANGSGYYGGPGGGGGYVASITGHILSGDRSISIVIGAGGQNNGTTGGATSVSIGGNLIVSANAGGNAQAPGDGSNFGSPGIGNGNGGSRDSGAGIDGTGYIFNQESLGPAGGGGGGLGSSSGQGFGGGSPFGGNGGISTVSDAQSGKGPGGGGGGGGSPWNATGAPGHAGGVYLRANYNA